jgi:hypothetical protein
LFSSFQSKKPIYYTTSEDGVFGWTGAERRALILKGVRTHGSNIANGSRECAPDAGCGAVLRDLRSVAFSTKAGKLSL